MISATNLAGDMIWIIGPIYDKSFTFVGMKSRCLHWLCIMTLIAVHVPALGQTDSARPAKGYNIIRYNLSSPVLFGFDKTIIFGYERSLRPNRSISVNFGTTALPRLANFATEDYKITRDMKNRGYNFSADFRFYLGKLNKYAAPRGVYIGPYYSYNSWRRDTEWEMVSTADLIKTGSTFNLHMAGFEMGYQFLFFNCVTLDLVLLGPGVGIYNLKTHTESTLSDEQMKKLHDAILAQLQEKFPGFSHIFEGKEIDSQGTLRTNSLGFRYLIHIGIAF